MPRSTDQSQKGSRRSRGVRFMILYYCPLNGCIMQLWDVLCSAVCFIISSSPYLFSSLHSQTPPTHLLQHMFRSVSRLLVFGFLIIYRDRFANRPRW
jgi:hypothetical protein